MTTIVVQKYQTRTRFGWRPYYECAGPDGTKFTNTSIVELRGVLKRHYGKVKLEVK